MSHDEDLKATQDEIVRLKTDGFDLIRELVNSDAEARKHMGCSDFERWITNHMVNTYRDISKAVEGFEKRWPDGESSHV